MECGEVQIEQKDKSCTFHSAALRSNTFSKYSETSVDKLPTIENNFHRSLVPTSPVILYCSKKWSTILVTKWIIIERFHCTYLVSTMSHTHKHQLSVNQWGHLKLYYATLRISCLSLTSIDTYPTSRPSTVWDTKLQTSLPALQHAPINYMRTILQAN